MRFLHYWKLIEPLQLHSIASGEERIRQALLQDDRITDIQDMAVTVTGDEALAEFTVVSTFGNFQTSRGVNQNV